MTMQCPLLLHRHSKTFIGFVAVQLLRGFRYTWLSE